MTVGSIQVRDVSKRFRLERNRPSSIKEALLRIGKRRDVDDFWVLRDISLDIAPGSFFGHEGERHVRVSVTMSTDLVREAASRLRSFAADA